MNRARAVLVALAVLACATPAVPARAASPARVATDAYSVTPPGKPWARPDALEPAGQLSWTTAEGPKRRLLRTGYEAAAATDPVAAVDAVLGRLRDAIRAEVDARTGVERSGFEADSIVVPGGLRWRGFRVAVRVGSQNNVSWRWVAVHPGFPAHRALFTLDYDEVTPVSSERTVGEKEARALAASLQPAGAGLASTLPEAWLDARAAAFGARIDSAQKLCWTHLPDGAGGRDHLGYGRGLALGADFFLYSNITPRDSLVDPAPQEYGVAFDRNADGRIDLVLLDRGVQDFAGGRANPTVELQADENFDGRIDALIVEDVDTDGDHRVEARLLLRDTDGDGRPDEAWTFHDSAAPGSPGTMRAKLGGGPLGTRRLAGSEAPDVAEEMRFASTRRGELDAARAACPVR